MAKQTVATNHQARPAPVDITEQDNHIRIEVPNISDTDPSLLKALLQQAIRDRFTVFTFFGDTVNRLLLRLIQYLSWCYSFKLQTVKRSLCK